MIYNGTAQRAIITTMLAITALLPISANSSLYEDFNNRINAMSNYAENKVAESASETTNRIYKENTRLLEQRLLEAQAYQDSNSNPNPTDTWNANNEDKLSEIAAKMVSGDAVELPFETLGDRERDQDRDRESQANADDGYDKNDEFYSGWEHDVSIPTGSAEESQGYHYPPMWKDSLKLLQKKDTRRRIPVERDSVACTDVDGSANGSEMMYGFDDGHQFAFSKNLRRKLKNYYPKRKKKRFRNSRTSDRHHQLARPQRHVVKRLDVSSVLGASSYPDVVAKSATQQLTEVADKIRQVQSAPLLNSPQIVQNLLNQNDAYIGPLQSVSDMNNRLPKQASQISAQSTAPQQPAATGCGQCAAAAPPLPSSPNMNIPSEAAQKLSSVLEKVLIELENLKTAKTANPANSTQRPEGAPCEVTGSWNSEVVGLQFDIAATSEAGINVDVQDRHPLKRNTLMDCDWICGGSALKKVGGPFYITAQKPEESSLATFAGLCKTCGGIDMIFGSWTFVYPAKDCQDVAMAIEIKRDVFRRNDLEKKKKERLAKLAKKADKSKRCKD